MAHYSDAVLSRPKNFNFAVDVVDYWASKSPPMHAMSWVSQTGKDHREITYEQFSRQSHRISVLLERLGVSSGETVLIILPRVPAWWEISVACLRSKIIICPATTLLVDKDIEFRCQKSKATTFIGDSTSVQKLLSVRENCPDIKLVLQVRAGAEQDKTISKGVVSFDDALRSIPDDVVFQPRETDAKDPAVIFFTSGTSGPPKMVLHSAISYPLAHTITGKHWLQLSPGKLYWNLSEQGWAKAAWSFFGAWNCGASLFIHDDRTPFKAAKVIETLHKYPITTLCAPPTAYRQMVLRENQKLFQEKRPRALQHCTGAGEPLNDEVIRIWQKMSGMEIYDGYGQTETILICGNFAGCPIRPGSMGKPSPGVPLAILDPQGNEAPVGSEGDIGILLGENQQDDAFFGVFDGYISEGLDAVRKTRTFPSSGGMPGKTWYLTGDRASRDAQGYYWFVGRSDDVINSAGYRIGPFEVESTLKLHPSVVESAVVASPDASRSEVVKAFVVLTDEYAAKSGDELVAELQQFCKEKAAPYKYPRKIQFVDGSFLPKTISGKIKRNELKKAEWEQARPKIGAPKL